MGCRDIEGILASAIRRRRLLHSSIAAAAAVIAVASICAVRFELGGGDPDGAVKILVSILEFVFITAIIPLIVTVIFFSASAVSLHRMLDRHVELPEARLRKLI
jgi:hypothetical protein